MSMLDLPTEDKNLASRLKPSDRVSTSHVFMDLREPNCIYVDRSQYIGEFLSSEARVHLLKRPRRSGKTTFLSTVGTFLQLDDNTKEARAAAFEELAISTKPSLARYWTHDFARHPVVHLSFGNLEVRHFDSFIETLGSKLCAAVQAAEEHGHLKHITPQDFQYLCPFLDDEVVPRNKVRGGLTRLCRIIARSTGSLPVLLIDEYESPIIHTRLNVLEENQSPESKKTCKAVCEFMNIMMTTLLKDPSETHNVSRCLLVGVCQIAQSGYLSGLNNVSVYGPDNDFYSTACLFTAMETEVLYVHYLRQVWRGIDPVPNFLRRMEARYNGFVTSVGVQLYNPYAVIEALHQRRIGSFWTNSGCDGLLQRLLAKLVSDDRAARGTSDALADFTQFLAGSALRCRYKELADVSQNLTSDLFWSMMFDAGYLTLAQVEPILYKIPNTDVLQALLNWQLDQYTTSPSTSCMSQIFSALLEGNAAETCAGFKEAILPIATDLLVSNRENCYHVFVVAALLRYVEDAREPFQIRMEQAAGDGKLDVAIIGWDNPVAAVLEFKRADSATQLPRMARAALNQIIEKKYLACLDPNIQRAQAIGLAFHKHGVSVTCQTFQRQNRQLCDFAASADVSEACLT